MLVEVNCDKWAKGQIEGSCGFLIEKKYVVGPRHSRRNILSWMVFNPTAGEKLQIKTKMMKNKMIL